MPDSPLRQLPLIAILRGITPAGMAAYVAAGASGFGLGSALYKPGMSAAHVSDNGRAFVAAWKATQH